MEEKKESKTTQFRNWVFTLQTKKEGEYKDKLPDPEFFLKIFSDQTNVEQVQFQAEKGELGRLHYQGFLTLFKKITKSGLLKWFGELNWIYFAPMRGDLGSNLRYTSKEDGRVAGPWRHSKSDSADNSSESREPRQSSASKRAKTRWPTRSEIPDGEQNDLQSDGRAVIVCCGPPGIGKTRIWTCILGYAYGPYGIYSVPARASQSAGRWIGEYTGEPSVLFDEFAFSDFQANQWKMMLDRYDVRVPAKMGGKSVLWQPQIVVLLTNALYKHIENNFLSDAALKRRLSLIWDWGRVSVSPLVSGPRIHAFL